VGGDVYTMLGGMMECMSGYGGGGDDGGDLQSEGGSMSTGQDRGRNERLKVKLVIC
jgi:hypothetical protein